MDKSKRAPMRPTQYVEHNLVTSILNGTYPVGTMLPSERVLAEQLRVTRPTLRETLQRLAKEGWVKIHHGKPTVVNDYWQEGGLGMLATLARYGQYMPNGFITHLLRVRLTLLPPIAGLAAQHHPQKILVFLQLASKLPHEPTAYADYDWTLQMLMARCSNNPVFPLILNDFSTIFQNMAARYFHHDDALRFSAAFYAELGQAIQDNSNTVEKLVRDAMERSIQIWHAVKKK
jgi:GntR family negative regulator for fad regulon and positive regulator of fabA